jgi:hypothetical protein
MKMIAAISASALLTGALLACTVSAYAQGASSCAPYKALIQAAKEKNYMETAGAVEGGEHPWVILSNPEGRYMMLAIQTDGMACLVSQGEAWFAIGTGEQS